MLRLRRNRSYPLEAPMPVPPKLLSERKVDLLCPKNVTNPPWRPGTPRRSCCTCSPPTCALRPGGGKVEWSSFFCFPSSFIGFHRWCRWRLTYSSDLLICFMNNLKNIQTILPALLVLNSNERANQQKYLWWINRYINIFITIWNVSKSPFLPRFPPLFWSCYRFYPDRGMHLWHIL